MIELLVGMAILGILLGVVMALQAGTISLSTGVAASGRVAEEQNATLNYIGDRFRSTSSTWVVPTTLTLATGVTCDTTSASAAKTCVAFAVPETNTAGDVVRCVLLAYRIEPRTEFTDRRLDDWADKNSIQIVREYRQQVATTACPATISAGGTWASAVVGDGFTLTGPTATIKPFAISVDKRTLTLTLRSAYRQNQSLKYFPASLPASKQGTTLTVHSRN